MIERKNWKIAGREAKNGSKGTVTKFTFPIRHEAWGGGNANAPAF